MSLTLSRTIHFNAAHRLYQADQTPEWNERTYGPAANVTGYGHNYALEVAVEGLPDADTAMIVNLTDIDRVLKDEVDAPLDHRNLNLDVPAFAHVVPTAENLALYIWDRVEARIRKEGWPCRLAHMVLTVTPSFAVEVTRG